MKNDTVLHVGRSGVLLTRYSSSPERLQYGGVSPSLRLVRIHSS